MTWLLGSHDYLLQCLEAWATQITVRYGLDTMFNIQWILWSETVPPGVKQLKAEYLGISGNTVEDWMKDLQIDATARPDRAFDLSFEIPEPDVGIRRSTAASPLTSGSRWADPTSWRRTATPRAEVDDRDDQDVQPGDLGSAVDGHMMPPDSWDDLRECV